jgi:hypothetical protein
LSSYTVAPPAERQGRGLVRKSIANAAIVVTRWCSARGIRQFFTEIAFQKISLPHECKPFLVNPAPFLPTKWRQLYIHNRKSLNAGTSDEETEPLAPDQVFHIFVVDAIAS